ncbi:type VI secretion system protein TssL, long form [Enterobacteriaceae bacterium LUAb1]
MSEIGELNHEQDFSIPAPDMNNEDPQALGRFLLDGRAPFMGERAGLSSFDSEGSYGTAGFDSNGMRYNTSQLRGESVQQRVEKVIVSSTPLLEAVQPLLRALSDMPEAISEMEQVALLKKGLKNEITLFSVVCDEADISWKKMAIVRYCICTALDEAAHTRKWGQEAAWSQSNLLNHFEGDNDGGNKFFLLIGRLSMSPQEYTDVLEVLLRILNLGFEGRYSIIEDGDRQLTKIRQRLLTLLQSTRDTVPVALSPHAVCGNLVRKRHSLFIPVRVSLLLGSVLIASTFITCKYFLVVPSGNMLQQMLTLYRQPVAIPKPQVRLRLAILLKEEIAKNLVSVDETTGLSQVVFRGDSMFAVGKDNIRPEMLPILQRVSEEIIRVKGQVLVVGYTDSTPIRRADFPNNQVLSEKRAERVTKLLQHNGISADNIRFEGRGEREPLGNNATVEGRAQNRRVEILVKY